MRSPRAIAALAAGSLLFAACGGGSSADSAIDNSTAPTATDAAPAATDAPPAPPNSDPVTDLASADDVEPASAVPEALQFSAPLVGGGELDASVLAGKPTVFWFWAPT